MEEDERIVLDGRLDEAVWLRAVPAGDFIQIEPNNGSPATEKTEIRIAYDRTALYIGMTAYDSEPDGWIAYQRRRDEGLPSDDKIRWTIDTFLDARSGYFFETNPLGHLADALMGVNGQNRAWDGVWTERVHHSEIGWTVEVEIPFRTSTSPRQRHVGHELRADVQRKTRRASDGMGAQPGLQRMTNAGHVTVSATSPGTRYRRQAVRPPERGGIPRPPRRGSGSIATRTREWTSSTIQLPSYARCSPSTPTSRRRRSISGRPT